MAHTLLKDLTCKWKHLEYAMNVKYTMILSHMLSSADILTHTVGVSHLSELKQFKVILKLQIITGSLNNADKNIVCKLTL